MEINLESSWLEILQDEFNQDYMKNLKSFLVDEQNSYMVYEINNLV